MTTKASATSPGTASLGIDIGGTFTDVVHLDHATGRQHALKVLTTHGDPSEAVIAGTRKLLERLLEEADLPRRALLQRSGVPADEIEAVVEAESIDVLVLGSMSRGRIGRLLLGSTAEKLLHAAVCDLLVVKPVAFRSPVTPARRGERGLLRGTPRLAGETRTVDD